jgi:hypothetical protein
MFITRNANMSSYTVHFRLSTEIKKKKNEMPIMSSATAYLSRYILPTAIIFNTIK